MPDDIPSPSPSSPSSGSSIDLASLEPLFRPRSIAVLGASSSPTKIGGRPVAALLANGFEGGVYPVNPRSETIQGLPAFASVTDVPHPVDLAICTVPAGAVMQVLRECADKGVGALLVFTSGFAEVGEGAAQEAMAGLAREAGIRLMGPNCMGMVNFRSRAVGSFHPAFCEEIEPGAIGLVSQSGAFGALCYVLARERGQSFSYMFTTGNEADVDVGDCTAFLAEDPDTKAILLYIEGCRNGPKFLEALERARANGKPVIAIKLGRTAAGAAAAASHTAALAGEDAVYDAIFRQFGVYRAESIEEFFDVARSCVVGVLPSNDRVAMITVSGGVGVLMADDADRRGLAVPPMPEAAQRRMRELVPFAAPRNPIDVTGQVLNDFSLLDQAIDLATGSGGYGSVVSFQGSVGRNPDMREGSRRGWLRRKAEHPGVHFAVCGFSAPDYVRDLEAAGIPVYEEATHATRAIAAMAGFARSFRTRRSRPAVPAGQAAHPLPDGPLDELAALEVLAAAGVPTVPARGAGSAEEAAAAAAEIGFPVAIKVKSPDIVHKSDAGGVRLGVADEAAAARAFEGIVAACREAAPEARIDGCLVAPMVSGGVETILGVQRDPVFGPIVMFGLGGIFVEALRDVTFRAAPFDEAEAHAMIRSIIGWPVLTGLRGRPACDLDALAAALSRLSLFAAANEAAVESLDVNPFLVRAEGAVALDAALVRRAPPERTPSQEPYAGRKFA